MRLNIQRKIGLVRFIGLSPIVGLGNILKGICIYKSK
jgi:hypothetical protein